MKKYIIRRCISGIITVMIVFTLNFILVMSAPGDPITTIIGKDTDDPVLRAALEEKYGLNKPLTEQYIAQLGNLIRGDLGLSIMYNRPVSNMIAEKVNATVLLGLTSALLSLILGTSLGIYCARREGSRADTTISTVSYTFDAMPSFWLGLMLIILLSTRLGLLPSQGMVNVRAGYKGFQRTLDIVHHMVLPTLTLVIVNMPGYFRIAKSSVLQVANDDFVALFRAVGMSEKHIFKKYIFRNAILPTVTLFGISMAFLITGVALIEIVFSWPGMGRVTMTAITQRDYPTLMGVYLVISISVAVVMVIVDVIYAFLDPRIRYD